MHNINWKRSVKEGGGSTKKMLLSEGANKALGASVGRGAMTLMPCRGV